ncbi:hypothetical protein ONS96_007282 [Cadophora gregata f. sp. sojae]|nr:hypothetical protein ONS96_007282 [Cadophora gregata f. sp. sojae]
MTGWDIPFCLWRCILSNTRVMGEQDRFGPLFLINLRHSADIVKEGGAGKALGMWFGETWGYTIILSLVYGATVGWIAKELLHWAEEKKFVDRESFLVFAITLALFIVGTCGMIGSDDVLACFIAGNTFTWDDWFRLETLDDSLQPTIDMLLNLSIFIWFGAICPWHSFVSNDIIPVYRLIFLGVLILLLRRLPIVFAMHKFIHQIEEKRQAIFVGFFGPIGVSAIFYLYISLEFLETITVDGEQREDAKRLGDTIMIVVWFLTICSIVVHGLSIPLGKLGFFLPRTLSRAFSTNNDEPGSFAISNYSRSSSIAGVLRQRRKKPSGDSTPNELASASASTPTRPIYKIGGSVIAQRGGEIGGGNSGPSGSGGSGDPETRPSTPPAIALGRTIRFPDDEDQIQVAK